MRPSLAWRSVRAGLALLVNTRGSLRARQTGVARLAVGAVEAAMARFAIGAVLPRLAGSARKARQSVRADLPAHARVAVGARDAI